MPKRRESQMMLLVAAAADLSVVLKSCTHSRSIDLHVHWEKKRKEEKKLLTEATLELLSHLSIRHKESIDHDGDSPIESGSQGDDFDLR